MPWEGYRKQLAENVSDMKFAQAVLRPRVTITEEELRDAWRRATKDSPARVHVQAIFLAWPKQADEAQRREVIARAEALRAQARTGEDFAALARKHDEGPFGAQGGEMGTFGPGELLPDLDAAVRGVQAGEVATPVATERGVFLLRVQERVAPAGGDYDTLKPRLQDAVFQQRMAQERVAWTQQARRKATVRVLVPELSGTP
jgi:parvulin-like peptidyl-prolyl isomerase